MSEFTTIVLGIAAMALTLGVYMLGVNEGRNCEKSGKGSRGAFRAGANASGGRASIAAVTTLEKPAETEGEHEKRLQRIIENINNYDGTTRHQKVV